MKTNDESKTVYTGLHVFYDGDRNTLLFDNQAIDYPEGGIITEYMRLSPSEIKPVIMSCNHLNDMATPDNIASFAVEFQEKLKKQFNSVIAIMVLAEFTNIFVEWFEAEREDRGDEYIQGLNESACYEDINEFIFADSGFYGIGKETVCQMVLSAYVFFVSIYIHTNYTFNEVLKWGEHKENANEKAIQLITSLYTDMSEMQHIDFRIINIQGEGFKSLYTIKSSMSLLTFEFAHWLNKGGPLGKCVNCGHYFIPDGRSDQIYCTYPSPQKKDKTCREIGAQITRANKEKNDIVTREYRKLYMRYKMLTKRHPENRDAARQFKTLTEGMKDWRKKLASGSATTDQFLDWIKQF